MRKPKRALITGGAGFIGSHLAGALLGSGWRVSVIDDLSTGSKDNIKSFMRDDNFEFHRASIFDEKLMQRLIDGCDAVFHLAAAVGVRLIIDQPVRTIETNIHGTEIVLRAASKGRKRVVITSSSEVYGKSEDVPFSEEDDLLFGSTSKSRWSYACSKAIDEFLALAYHREKKLPVTIARLFNTVGPRQTGRYGMVLPTFIGQALAGKPITVFGNGRQTRVFLYVGDAVDCLIKLIEEPRAVGEVFNVGGDSEISIRALAGKVKRMLKSDSKIVMVPYDEAYEEGFEDLLHRVPDISKAAKILKFRPGVGIDDIIKSIAEHERAKAVRRKGRTK